MKKVTLFILLLISFVGYSQKELDSIQIFAAAEIAPEYPGGINAFRQFIAENYRNPKTDKNIKGTIVLTFVIEPDGSLSSIKVIRDLGYGTGAEAVRVLKKSKKWKPGVQNGRPIRVMYNLPLQLNIKKSKK